MVFERLVLSFLILILLLYLAVMKCKDQLKTLVESENFLSLEYANFAGQNTSI